MKEPDHFSAALLIRFVGLMLLITSFLCSPWIAGYFDPTPPLEVRTISAIQEARMALFGLGIALFVLAELIEPATISRSLSRAFDKPFMTKALFSLLVFIVPLLIAEVVLRPFTIAHLYSKKETTLFIRDADLGWRMRPDARTTWGGAQVSINNKGMRGPAIPYTRTPSKPRLLYLGDSVTFGYLLANYDEAYPYRVEAKCKTRLGLNIETINSAVDGYSTWQESLFLEREGVKYSPDLVVLGFVLNDVTERFGLVRFGGAGEGNQLDRSYSTITEWLQQNSAVYFALNKFKARLRFGVDVRKGAVARELATVEDLALSPDSKAVRGEWSQTLLDMDKLVRVCEREKLQLAIIIFPFVFQFKDPIRLSAPQQELVTFCNTRNIPCLDLLPLLNCYLENTKKEPAALFLDDDHPSIEGSDVIADCIVEWLRSEPKLWSHMAHPRVKPPVRGNVDM